MKKLTSLITVAGLCAVVTVMAADRKVVVPKGKTYVQVDKKGKELKRFGSGQSMGITDCAKIACPSTFPKDYVCWTCEERPISSGQ